MTSIPESYNHKATSDNYGGTVRVIIYYSNVEDKYLLHLVQINDMEIPDRLVFLTKTELELIVHAGTDVIDNSKV